MCTAAVYKTKDFYFGRTLDYEFSYGDEVTVTPRNYPFHFRNMGDMESHYAMIGMATVADGYPLYYEATNEAGLSMAGLNFPGNAVFFNPVFQIGFFPLQIRGNGSHDFGSGVLGTGLWGSAVPCSAVFHFFSLHK